MSMIDEWLMTFFECTDWLTPSGWFWSGWAIIILLMIVRGMSKPSLVDKGYWSTMFTICVMFISVSLMAILLVHPKGHEYVIGELIMTEEMVAKKRVDRAQANLKYARQTLKKKNKKKLRDARRAAKIALIQAKADAKIARLKAEERRLRDASPPVAVIVAESKARRAQTRLARAKNKPATLHTSPALHLEQIKIIISGLWLAVCFFLQRLLEKAFRDKGYALLTVCTLGFFIAFLTANYILLGSSVTGGIIGSVGHRS